MNLPPIFQQCILKLHSFWKEERKTGAGIMHHEKAQFPSKLSVIPLSCLLHHSQVAFQFFFAGKSCCVDSSQHLVLLAASPVGSCQIHKLKCFTDAFCIHQMRPGTKIREFSLTVKADFSILFPGKSEAFQGKAFLNDFFHFSLNLRQILRRQRRGRIDVVIKAVCNRRSDCQFGIRVQALYGLCHHMAGCMAQRSQSVFILCRQNV